MDNGFKSTHVKFFHSIFEPFLAGSFISFYVCYELIYFVCLSLVFHLFLTHFSFPGGLQWRSSFSSDASNIGVSEPNSLMLSGVIPPT